MTLEIIYNAYGEIQVSEIGGGVWYPSDEAAMEISVADDPEEKAIQICETQPMRGVWHS
jgi:hypothetical protein